MLVTSRKTLRVRREGVLVTEGSSNSDLHVDEEAEAEDREGAEEQVDAVEVVVALAELERCGELVIVGAVDDCNSEEETDLTITGTVRADIKEDDDEVVNDGFESVGAR